MQRVRMLQGKRVVHGEKVLPGSRVLPGPQPHSALKKLSSWGQDGMKWDGKEGDRGTQLLQGSGGCWKGRHPTAEEGEAGWGRGVANGLSAAAELQEGFFGHPGSGQGWEMGWAWWVSLVLLLLGCGWPWERLWG